MVRQLQLATRRRLMRCFDSDWKYWGPLIWNEFSIGKYLHVTWLGNPPSNTLWNDSFSGGGMCLAVECFRMAVLCCWTKHVLYLGPGVPKGGQKASTFKPTNLAIMLPVVALSNVMSYSICSSGENTNRHCIACLISKSGIVTMHNQIVRAMSIPPTFGSLLLAGCPWQIPLWHYWLSAESNASNGAVLQVKQCRGSLTPTVRDMLKNWKIPLPKLHVFYLFCISFEEAAMYIVLFLQLCSLLDVVYWKHQVSDLKKHGPDHSWFMIWSYFQ